MIVPPEQFAFGGPTYLSASPFFDAQRSINLYPEPGHPTSKSRMALIGRPGLSAAFVTINSPARCLWAGDNRLFAVGGTHVYEIGYSGTIIADFGAMADSGSKGPCYFQHDGIHFAVCDRSSGHVFYCDPGASYPSTAHLDNVFNGLTLEYLDGYFITIAVGASLVGSNPNQISVSAYGDPTSWPATNYVLRMGASDLVVQLANLNNLLWIFGRKTIEVWYNAGNPYFPFARVNGGTINLGCLSSASVVKFSNCLMWLGSSHTGYAQVYLAQGMAPARVSNFGIEQLLGQNTALLPTAWAYGYEESGHVFYVLNLVDANYENPALSVVYDLTTGLWHERMYRTTGSGPWPVCHASVVGFSTYATFVGDAYSGVIRNQDTVNFKNDGAAGNTIYYVRTCPHFSAMNQWVTHNRFELVADIGSAQPQLDWSNDGGKTFAMSAIGLQQAMDQGKGTNYSTFRRYYATELGRARDRVYRVIITDGANLIRLVDAYLEVG